MMATDTRQSNINIPYSGIKKKEFGSTSIGEIELVCVAICLTCGLAGAKRRQATTPAPATTSAKPTAEKKYQGSMWR